MIYSKIKGFRISRLGLGAVQFGLDYSFTKTRSQDEVDEILSAANKAGINLIDTAPAYGDAETKIGSFLSRNPGLRFHIATKTPKIPGEILSDATKIYDFILRSTEQSLEHLKANKVLLIQTHQADDSDLLNEGLWRALQKIKARGLTSLVGASVYDPKVTRELIERYRDLVDSVQVPFNIVNGDFAAMHSLFEEKKIAVISRSAYLRGVLVHGKADAIMTPDQAHAAYRVIEETRAKAQAKLLSVGEYSLLTSLAQDWVASTLVGMVSPDEINGNVKILSKSKYFIRSEATDGVICMVQARMSSTRLPGKVLMPILGEPMLARQIERLCLSKQIGKIVVLTSDEESDGAIAELCNGIGIECFRGSLQDVLDRFYQASKRFSPSHIVRITADCPLIDAELMDSIIAAHLKSGADYTSNTLVRTYPDGLDVEVIRQDVLKTAWKEAVLDQEREHVTPFIYNHPERFKLQNYAGASNFSDYQWSVDYEKDLRFVRNVYEGLYPVKADFAMADILDTIKKTSRNSPADYDAHISHLDQVPRRYYKDIDITWAHKFKTYYQGCNIPDVPGSRFRFISSRKPIATLMGEGGENIGYKMGLPVSLRWQIDQMHRFFRSHKIKELHIDEDISVIKNCLVQCARLYGVKSFVHLHGCLGQKPGFLPLTADKIIVWDERQKTKIISWGCEADRVVVGGYAERYAKPLGLDRKVITKKVIEDLSLDPSKRVILVAAHSRTDFYDGQCERVKQSTQFIQEAIIENPGEQFVIKLHPGSRDEEYWKMWKRNSGLNHVRIAKVYDPFHLLIATNILIAHHSTYAIDGFVFRKPVIIIDDGLPSGVEEYEGEFQKVSNREALVCAIRNVVVRS